MKLTKQISVQNPYYLARGELCIPLIIHELHICVVFRVDQTLTISLVNGDRETTGDDKISN